MPIHPILKLTQDIDKCPDCTEHSKCKLHTKLLRMSSSDLEEYYYGDKPRQ